MVCCIVLSSGTEKTFLSDLKAVLNASLDFLVIEDDFDFRNSANLLVVVT